MESKNTHDVVLKMVTNTREIHLHVNVGSSQDVLRSDPALHQDIGTSDRTSSQDDLLPNVDRGNGTTLDPGELDSSSGELVVENDLGNGSIWQDLQVITRRQRVDISNTRVRTSPVGGIDGRRGDEGPRR